MTLCGFTGNNGDVTVSCKYKLLQTWSAVFRAILLLLHNHREGDLLKTQCLEEETPVRCVW